MLKKLTQYLNQGGPHREVIKAVYDHPYADKKTAFQELTMNEQELDTVLDELEEQMIVLSLTTQADSNIESRVPKKIFLINPDLETQIADLL